MDGTGAVAHYIGAPPACDGDSVEYSTFPVIPAKGDRVSRSPPACQVPTVPPSLAVRTWRVVFSKEEVPTKNVL